MEILNERVKRDLESGKLLNLNLGGGSKPMAGYYNVDILKHPVVDILADLNHPLYLLPENSVSSVYCRHTLEHIRELHGLLEEVFRILDPMGQFEVVVPHFSNPYGFSDPTHVRFFGIYTFAYFGRMCQPMPRSVPNYFGRVIYDVEHVSIRFYRDRLLDRIIVPLIEPVINRSFTTLDAYERRWSRMYPAHEIRFVLKPIKSNSAAAY